MNPYKARVEIRMIDSIIHRLLSSLCPLNLWNKARKILLCVSYEKNSPLRAISITKANAERIARPEMIPKMETFEIP